MAGKIEELDLRKIQEDPGQYKYKKEEEHAKERRGEPLKQAALDAMYAIAVLQVTDPDQFEKKMSTLPHAAQQRVLEIIASEIA